ncbi:MAG: peptidylprolyl isomerase [Phycisphaerales bacterium]|nr:peptidylprolyl isomerase [Phycisphaerales bacterium]
MKRLLAAVAAAVSIAGSAGAEDPKPAAAPATPPPVAADTFAYAKLTTSKGEILLELNETKAPISTANFMKYVEAGFYNGTVFHRVIPGFMIQGGGMLPDMTEKKDGVREPIKNEWQNGLKNVRGSIAMARTNMPDSATCQFYINVVDNAMLDMPRGGAAYAVFGTVIKGMEAADAIVAVPTGSRGPHQNVPNEPVVITKAERVAAESIAAEIAAHRKAVAGAEAKKKEAEEAARKAAAEAESKGMEAGLAFAKSQGADADKVQKLPSGLWFIDAKVGDGPAPAGPTSTVRVHYTGWLTNGTKFDSSRDRGQDISFPLNGVIKGWTEGVGSMKTGGRRWLIIPAGMAYGAAGRPSIPPNSVLVFDVELFETK